MAVIEASDLRRTYKTSTEAAIGAAYAVTAYFMLHFFEEESRRRATLDRM